MLAIIKLVPLKDWLYCGLIAALLMSFGVYTHHERVVGEQKIEVVDAKAVQLKTVQNQKVESSAQASVDKAVDEFHAAVDSPEPIRIPSLVCSSAADDSRPVSSHGGTAGGSDDAAAPAGGIPEESSVPFNPAPAIIADADEADKLSAQVKLLQDYVVACQIAGICAR